MIIEVVGKEIEKIKGDFESYLNGLNMVGEISYSQYSKLYDEGTKQIQRAYELGRAELEKENAELKEQCSILADCNTCVSDCKTENIEIKKQLTKAKELLKQWVELFKPKGGNIPPTPIQVDTEQFLNSEVEK